VTEVCVVEKYLVMVDYGVEGWCIQERTNDPEEAETMFRRWVENSLGEHVMLVRVKKAIKQ